MTGFSLQSIGHELWNLDAQKMIVSRDSIFIEFSTDFLSVNAIDSDETTAENECVAQEDQCSRAETFVTPTDEQAPGSADDAQRVSESSFS